MSQNEPSATAGARFSRNSLDGEHRLYTAAVITAGSMWLAALVWDRGFLESEGNVIFFRVVEWDIPTPIKWILWSIILYFWAVMDGIVCYMALLPNVRVRERQGIELKWVILQGLGGVVLMNYGTVALFWLGKQRFKERASSKIFFSTPAHFYIHCCLWLSVLVMDVLYIVAVHRPHTQINRANSLQPAMALQPWRTIIGDFTVEFTVDIMVGFIEYVLVKPALWVWGCIQPCLAFVDRKTRPTLRCWYNFLLRIESGNHCTQPSDRSQPRGDNAEGQAAGGVRATLREWNRVGMVSIWQGAEAAHTRVAQELLSAMRVFSEEDTTFAFKHSAWVISGMVTSLMLMPYWALQLASFVRDFVFKVYLPNRSCVTQNEVIYRDVLRMFGFGEQRNPDRFKFVAVIEENLDRFRYPTASDTFFNCQSREAAPAPGVAFLNIMQESFAVNDDPVQEFRDSTFGSVVLAVDAIIVHLRWASIVGAVLGSFFALRTLTSVLGQYKRASQAAWDRTENPMPSQTVSISSVLELESPAERWRQARFFKVVHFRSEWGTTYPLDMAAHFIGALVSTVALQMFSAFVVASLILAAFGSLVYIVAVVSPFLGLFFVTVLTFAVEELIFRKAWMKSIATGYTVHQPCKWLFYLITHSMINLILGILRALLRLLGMVLVAILRLGRLDVNQYPKFQSWDTAEVAFGAMVLMHHQADVGGGAVRGNQSNSNQTSQSLQLPIHQVSSAQIDVAYERERRADSGRPPAGRMSSAVLVSPFATATFPGMHRGGQPSDANLGVFGRANMRRAESATETTQRNEQSQEWAGSGRLSRYGSSNATLRIRRGRDLSWTSSMLNRAEQALELSPPPSPSQYLM